MFRRLALLSCLFSASLVRAADGDALTDRTVRTDQYVRRVFLLCDDKDADDTSCTEMNLVSKSLDLADYLIFRVDTTTAESSTACTGTIAIRNYGVTGGVGQTALKPTLTTLTIGTTESAKAVGPISQFVDAALTLGGCTGGTSHDNLDVVVEGYFKRGQ